MQAGAEEAWLAAAGADGAWVSPDASLVVERMRAGDTPEEACLHALRRVGEQARTGATWQPVLWAGDRPSFGLTFYAVRKDGLYGSASMLGKPGSKKCAVADRAGARLEACAIAFPS